MEHHEKQVHVKVWQTGGLTKAAYARQNDINMKTFGHFKP